MNRYLKIVFFFLLFWQMQYAFAQDVDTIALNTTHSFEASEVTGYSYSWWFINPTGSKVDFSSTTYKTEERLWDTEGTYQLYVQATDSNGCLSEIISQKFVVWKRESTLLVSAGNDTLVGSCNSYQLQSSVSGTATGLSYQWSPADYLDDATLANPVFTPGETTKYTLTVTANDGTKATDSVTISVSEILANAGDDITTNSETTISLNGNASTGKDITYLWTTNNGNIVSGATSYSPEVNSGGTYFLQVNDAFGCTSVDSVKVTWNSTLLVSAGNDTLVGSCNSYQLQSSVSGTATGLTYQWSPADYLDDATLANPVFTPGETTKYTLTVTANDGTTATDEVTISVSEILANAGDDITIEHQISSYLDASGSIGEDLSYSWTTTNGEIVSDANTAYPEIDMGGVYKLEVTDLFGCSSVDSAKIVWIADAPDTWTDYDTTAYQSPVSISVLTNDDPDIDLSKVTVEIISEPSNGSVVVNSDNSVVYTPIDGFSGEDYFEYRICESEFYCYTTHVYVTVTDNLFYIPQAFSPNGDGINDYFEILGIEYYPNNSLTVINRWGKTVYKASKYGIETEPKFWDGVSNQTSGNKELPTGTYFYVFNPGNGEKRIAGYVYIDR